MRYIGVLLSTCHYVLEKERRVNEAYRHEEIQLVLATHEVHQEKQAHVMCSVKPMIKNKNQIEVL
jgi:hypothetical protein